MGFFPFSMHFTPPPVLPVADVSDVSGVLTLQGLGLRADPPLAPALMFALVTFDQHQTFICVITWKQIVETKNLYKRQII